MTKILFADLDGTLIQTKSGATFAKGPWDWVLTPGILEAIDGYQPDLLHVVSNQGGISKGLVKESDWRAKIGRILEKIKEGTKCHPICTYDYCKSENPRDPDRKPNPGMIERFLVGKDRENLRCLMIGDASGLPGNFSGSDWEAAKAAGIQYLDIEAFLEIYGR